MRTTAILIRLLFAAVLLAISSAVAIQGSRAATSLADIRVSFKLDPRLTQSLYMGDRWVSPPTYSRFNAASGTTINVRAVGIDVQRKRVPISATWTVADPELATVSPVKDSEVRITIHKEGQSELVVSSDNISKTMVIKCVQQDGVWRVDISQ